MKIPGPVAWQNVTGAPSRRWGHDLEAFERAVYPVAYTPKFKIGIEQRYFCIGSCFARNIEEHLIYRDAAVLSKQLKNPPAEWPINRPNGIVNKYTTDSMLNEVRCLEQPMPAEQKYYLQTDGGWLDPQLSRGAKPVTLERAVERRSYLTAEYFSRLHEADVVILTLGLNEVWYDEETGLRLNAPPPAAIVRDQPDRFSLEVTPVAHNVAVLEELRDRLRQRRPDLKIVVTVSPVPMAASFTGEDVVAANNRSKSILRAAAWEFSGAHADVDYFPSYEMVASAPSAKAFQEDHRHVAENAVSEIAAMFFKSHGIDGTAPNFSEADYLAANPEVDRAVRQGALISGFHHWRDNRQLAKDASIEPQRTTAAI